MSDLDSKTIRKSLEPGKRHQEPLAEGRYLVYRKAPTVQTGIWSVKYWDAVAKKSHLAKLAMADDVLDANGSDILTYDQAVKAADGKLKAMLREADLIAGGEEAAEALNLGRSLTFALINEGRLHTVRLGRKIIIPVTELQAFLDRESASS
jgi:excisionase family DNA binding protein